MYYFPGQYDGPMLTSSKNALDESSRKIDKLRYGDDRFTLANMLLLAEM